MRRLLESGRLCSLTSLSVCQTQTFILLWTIIPTSWRQRHCPRDCGERPFVSRLPLISLSFLLAGDLPCRLACDLPCRPLSLGFVKT